MSNRFELAADWRDEVQDLVHPKIVSLTQEATEIAKKEVPIRTGYLYSTIDYEIVDEHGEVFSNTDYDHFVEFNNKSFLRVALFYLSMKLGGGVE